MISDEFETSGSLLADLTYHDFNQQLAAVEKSAAATDFDNELNPQPGEIMRRLRAAEFRITQLEQAKWLTWQRFARLFRK